YRPVALGLNKRQQAGRPASGYPGTRWMAIAVISSRNTIRQGRREVLMVSSRESKEVINAIEISLEIGLCGDMVVPAIFAPDVHIHQEDVVEKARSVRHGKVFQHKRIIGVFDLHRA